VRRQSDGAGHERLQSFEPVAAPERRVRAMPGRGRSDVEVDIAVVVEVPGHDGEAALWTDDSRLRRNVGEGPIAPVAVETIGRVVVGYVEVRAAIPVEVAPGPPLGHASIDDAGCRGDVDERAVSAVAEELAGERKVFLGFVADIEIEVAVAVVVGPGRCLTGIVNSTQTRGEGHVGEHA